MDATRKRGRVRVAAGTAGAALALSLASCALQRASLPVYADYARLVPYRCETPLARDVRYTYTTANEIKAGPDGFVSVADDDTLAAYRQTGTVPMLSGTTGLSDSLSAQGRAASSAGRHGDAYVYHDLSVSAARIEQAMGQVQAASNMLTSYADAMNALAALAPVLARQSAERVVSWLRTQTGCVGEGAPEGSVVHVDLNRMLHATAFTVSSQTDLQVTAVLDDGRGGRFRAERGYRFFVHPADSPPDDLPADAVDVDLLSDAPLLQAVAGDAFDMHLTLLANSAIAELDRQVSPAR